MKKMDEDIFYDNIQKVLENLPGNFNILEERVDVEIQMQYFEFVEKFRNDIILTDSFENRDLLFSHETGIDRKKEILVGLATFDDVLAYRTIERFVENSGELRSWAILAMQESRMLLQSSLLDEQQFFISTGLGGKGQKLRYFVVFINRDQTQVLNETQRKLIKEELIFELNGNEGEFESMDFMEEFSTALVILPLKADLKQIFRNIIDECNQYGNFLMDDMVVTNVKVLSRGEITELLQQNEKPDFNEG